MNTLFEKSSVLYMFRPGDSFRCINCAMVGIENTTSNGKHCAQCGCIANNNPHNEIAG